MQHVTASINSWTFSCHKLEHVEPGCRLIVGFQFVITTFTSTTIFCHSAALEKPTLWYLVFWVEFLVECWKDSLK